MVEAALAHGLEEGEAVLDAAVALLGAHESVLVGALARLLLGLAAGCRDGAEEGLAARGAEEVALERVGVRGGLCAGDDVGAARRRRGGRERGQLCATGQVSRGAER